jgi:hypothetical protein
MVMRASSASLLVLIVVTAGCGQQVESGSSPRPEGVVAAGPSDQPIAARSGDPPPAAISAPLAPLKPSQAKGDKPDAATHPDDSPKPADEKTPSGERKGPIYGLPLEIKIEAPPVPEKIQGPTPVGQVKPK